MTCKGMMVILLCSFVIMFTVFSAYCEDNAQKQLSQYLSELQKNPNDTALREKIIRHVQMMKPAPAVPEDTKRSMVRGKMAFEGAKTEADFKQAVAELQKATDTTPWFAAPYYNLGLAQERSSNLPDAIKSFKLYLVAAPSANDAEAVKTRIYGLEYKLEQKQKGDNRDQELKEILSQVKALGTYRDYLDRNVVLQFSGCTAKRDNGFSQLVFSLSDMDLVEISSFKWAKEGYVELHARNFVKAVTDTIYGASKEGCALQNICNGTEYKDKAVLSCVPPRDVPKMKQLLERAIELCAPQGIRSGGPLKGKQ